MNKQEFKNTITRQVNDSQSAFNLLMLDLNSKDRKYLKSRFFHCSEFDTGVYVETLNDYGQFRLTFHEGEDANGRGEGTYMDLSMTQGTGSRTYAIEHIQMGPMNFTFFLKRCKLSAKDYVFTLKPMDFGFYEGAVFAFDAVDFVAPLMWTQLLSDCRKNRADSSLTYVDYVVTPIDILSVDNLKWRPLGSDDMKRTMYRLFSTVRNTPEESQMMQILEGLSSY